MSENDDKSEQVTATGPFGAVPRRGFLKYLSAVFATAALPDVLPGCSTGPGGASLGTVAEDVDFGSVPMFWVTRKDDNLSLGFQFSGLGPDANHNLNLTSGTTAGNAYIAITFPPQHVIEDAVASGATDTLPLASYASGTSRLVFQIPATYGVAGGLALVPYDLNHVLQLCALSTLNVGVNAMSNAGTTTIVRTLLDAPAPPKSLARAKIDRTLARVDAPAAARVVARLKGASPDIINPIRFVHHGTTPVAPASGETSIELPHRLLISPNENTAWSYATTPVKSVESRTELWNARMGLRNPATGLADPSLGGLAARALWTRDYDIFGNPVPAGEPGPVANQVPNPQQRDWLVQDTGNMSGGVTPPLNISRLMLTPLGGTMDFSNTFTPSGTNNLAAWTQRITLGRDEYAEVVTVGSLLPFGHAAAVVSINKRCDNPSYGTVGTLYNTTYIVVGEPLVSFQNAATPADYNTFPFVAVELTQTKIACAGGTGGTANFVTDPAGNYPWVGAIGTDHKGRAIKFTTPLLFIPGGTTGAALTAAMGLWNGGGDGGPPGYSFEGQRVAFAPPPDSSSTSNSFNSDSTSFEATTFAIALNTPTGVTPTATNLVPWMRWITLSIDAVRHLTPSTGNANGTSNSSATFDYDLITYKKNAFDPSLNAHEIFLTLTPGQTNTPQLNFGGDASKSGALVTPNMGIAALSRTAGTISGSLAPPKATTSALPIYTGAFDPGDFFNGFNPQLFGFVPLASIIQKAASGVNGLASQYMPKVVSQQLSNAEAFLQKAMALYQTVQTASAQAQSLAAQAQGDANALAALGNGSVKNDAGVAVNAAGTPLTQAEKAAYLAASTAASSAITNINTYVTELNTLVTTATTAANDVTGLAWTALLGKTGMDGDLGAFLTAVDALLTSIAALKASGNQTSTAGQTAAAAAAYMGTISTAITSATSTVKSFLSGAAQLLTDLNTLSQGLELPKNLSVEVTWRPMISGLECGNMVAFIPSSAQALSLDIAINSTSVNGQPAGANVTCRLDQFAIAFGGSLPTGGDGGTTPGGTFCQFFPPTNGGVQSAISNADVTLVFDHMQFQMLAGQKPDVDVVFGDIYFGGDLKFVEVLKNALPLDAFSDPPFVDIDTSGITAGFNLSIPDIAVGMFSIENMSISASLTMPFISTNGKGVTFEFDFCTIDNPFLVTVSMLGGGGFFGMGMDMTGLTRVQLGIEVCAQLAISLLDIVSGSVSIEVGIFILYLVDAETGNDPVSGEPEPSGWTIGGYLRLRGELDIAGIITIAIELYLQITYSTSTGKCTASGYIQIDVSVLFFSLHAKPSFSRTFAGSNGDPTFVQLMGVGTPSVDPMFDPTTGGEPIAVSKVANATWDPFAEYCMAFA